MDKLWDFFVIWKFILHPWIRESLIFTCIQIFQSCFYDKKKTVFFFSRLFFSFFSSILNALVEFLFETDSCLRIYSSMSLNLINSGFFFYFGLDSREIFRLSCERRRLHNKMVETSATFIFSSINFNLSTSSRIHTICLFKSLHSFSLVLYSFLSKKVCLKDVLFRVQI